MNRDGRALAVCLALALVVGGIPFVVPLEVSASPPSSSPSVTAVAGILPQSSGPNPGLRNVVKLTWTGVPSATSYNVYRGDETNPPTLLATVTTTTYLDRTGLVSGRTYTYRVSAVNSDGEGPQSSPTVVTPGGTRFDLYPSTVAGTDSNELSVGSNWNTGAILFNDRFRTTKARVDDSDFPPALSFSLINSGEVKVVGLDPILFTDSVTGRTWDGELVGACTQEFYTDNDGASWTPSVNPCGLYAIDHPTLASGPYPSFPLGGGLYPRAVYYCAQGIAEAACATSFDGGRTFGPPVPIYTLLTCGGLHGMVRVGPDGSAYVPNKNCGGRQGFVVSTDNGLTWSLRTVPGSSPSRFDPKVAIGSGNRIYFAYSDGGATPRVAISNDKGLTFTIKDLTPPGKTFKFSEFMTAVAGDNDRAAVAWLGTTVGGSSNGCNQGGSNQPIWHLYVSLTYDGGNTWETTQVTPDNDPVQVDGLGDPNAACRNLLDFMDMTVDKWGRVIVAFQDGCTPRSTGGVCQAGSPPGNSRDSLPTLALQTGGRGLFRIYDPPTLPSAPLNLEARGIDGSVLLSWSPPSSSGGSPILGYKIYKGTSPGSLALLTTLGNVLNFEDFSVTNGQTYYYSVSAFTEVGEGPRSSTASATPGPVSPPGAPTLLSATAGNGRVTLKWNPPLSDGGSPILTYRLYRGPSASTLSPLFTVGNVLSFTDTGLTNGVTYFYAISALNSEGEGPQSSPLSSTPLSTTLNWPEAFHDPRNSGSTGGEGLLSTLPPPLTADLGAPALAGVAIAQLDSDPSMEIVASAGFRPGDGVLRVLAYDVVGGSLVLKWSSGNSLAIPPTNTVPNDGRLNTPWVGDLDGDGNPEVVVTGAYVINAQAATLNVPILAVLDGRNGNLLSAVGLDSSTTGTSLLAPPAVGDVDGDGVREIVVGGIVNSEELQAWTFTRSGGLVKKWIYNQPNDRDMDMKPALVELDSTHPGLEIVVGTMGGNSNGQILLFKPTTSGPGSPLSVEIQTGVRGVSVGNLDSDPRKEIAVNGQITNTLSVVECNADTSCTSLSRVHVLNAGYLWNTPSLSDLNGDGIEEIVVANSNNFIDDTDHEGSLRVYRFSGSALSLLSLLSRVGDPLHDLEVEGGVSVGDIDGDGIRELTFASRDGSIYAYKLVGPALVPLWSYATSAPIVASVALGDVDGDGFLDLVVPDSSGRLYVFVGKDLQPPTKVTGVRIQDSGAGSLILTFDAAQDNVAVSGYEILRSSTLGGPYTLVGTTPWTTFTDTGVPQEVPLYYVVRAKDTSGNVGPLSLEAQGIARDVVPPSKVENLSVQNVGTGDRLLLSWKEAQDNVGVDHYVVQRSLSPTGPFSTIASHVLGTSYLDTGLLTGTTYFYTVFAVDGRGNAGPASDISSGTPTVITDSEPPSPVTGLVVVPVSESRLDLVWNPATDNVGIDHYVVERSGSSSGPFVEIGTSPTTSFSDTGLPVATTFYYRVFAVDTSGNRGPPSSVASGRTPDLTPPSQVENLVVTGTTTSTVSLSWNPATDNVGVDHYNVLRGTATGGPYTVVGTTSSTSFTDTGLADNTDYFYVVEAVDGDGNHGPRSNEVLAHTLELITSPKPILQANRTSANLPEGASIRFDGSGSIPTNGNTITQYNFDFGDGESTGFQSSPVVEHTYTTFGRFTVTLIVRDSSGAESARPATLTITINNVKDALQNRWYPSIQEALDSSIDSSKILVFPGTYRESLVFPIRSGIVLCAALVSPILPDSCMASAGPTIEGTVEVRGESPRLEGFRIVPRQSPPVTAIFVQGNGATLAHNEIHLPLGGLDLASTNPFPNPSQGIVIPHSSGVTVEGNLVVVDDFSTPGWGVGGAFGLWGNLENSSIVGNTFQGWMGGAIGLSGGGGNTIEENRLEVGGAGVVLCPSSTALLRRNTFALLSNGVVLCEGRGAPVLRENVLGPTTAVAVRITPQSGTPSGLVIDARSNDWGVYSWPLISTTRIIDEGTNNKVLFTPFRTPQGTLEPREVRVLGPTSHCETSGAGDPDVLYDRGAPAGSRCKGFLTISAALRYAHPHDTVVVPPSSDSLTPTPRFESVVIDRNSLGEILSNLTLCSSTSSTGCEGASPSQTIVDSTGLSESALRVRAPSVQVVGFTFRVREEKARVVDLRGALKLDLRESVVEAGPAVSSPPLDVLLSPPTIRSYFLHPFVRESLEQGVVERVEERLSALPHFLGAVPVLEPTPHLALLFQGRAPSNLPPLPDGTPPVEVISNYTLKTSIAWVPRELWEKAQKIESAPQGPLLPSPTSGIGPGSQIITVFPDGSVGSCTSNFIWKDPSNTYYLGSAGHCFMTTSGSIVNQDIPVYVCVDRCIGSTANLYLSALFGGRPPEGLPGLWLRLGKVAFAQTTQNSFTATDFGLVRIPDSALPLVRPWMWFWAGPTQVATLSQPQAGDVALHYGHGTGAGEVFLTEGRAGRFAPNQNVPSGCTGCGIRWLGTATPGDSGSAVGRLSPSRFQTSQLFGDLAVGITTHLGAGVQGTNLYTNFGTHVQRARSMAQAVGLDVTVVLESDPILLPLPGVVGSLAVLNTGTGTSLQVTWSPPSSGAQVSSYKVYRAAGSGSFQSKALVGSTTQTTFLDTGLVQGTTYCYQVTAVSVQGQEGSPSPEACGTPFFVSTPPSAPTFVSALDPGTGGKLTVIWGPSSSPRPISHYRVERDGGMGFVPVGTSTERFLLDSGLENGRTYRYRVQAVDDEGTAGSFGLSPPSSPTTQAVAREWPQAQRTTDATAFTAAAGEISIPAISSSVSLGGPITSTPLVVDLNGDGRPEVVVARDMSNALSSIRVDAYTWQEGLVPLWSREIPADPILNAPPTRGFARMAAGVLGSTGRTDVVVYTNHLVDLGGVTINDGKLTVLEGPTGAIVATNTADITIGLPVDPRIGDVLPGGGNEIVLLQQVGGTAGGYYLQGYQLVGSALVKAFESLVSTSATLAPPLLLDADPARGGLEIVVADGATASSSVLYLCRPAGGSANCTSLGSVPTGVRFLAAGHLEPTLLPSIVAQGSSGSTLYVRSLDPLGTSAGVSPSPLQSPPSLVDLRGRGLSDIASVRFTTSASDLDRSGNVYFHGIRGSSLDRIGFLPRSPSGAETLRSPGGVVSADIDGDGSWDVLLGDSSGNVVAIRPNLPGPTVLWALPLGSEIRAPLALGDVDGDGKIEVVAATSEGRVVVIDQAPLTLPTLTVGIDVGGSRQARLSLTTIELSSAEGSSVGILSTAPALGTTTIEGSTLSHLSKSSPSSFGIRGLFENLVLSANTLQGWGAFAVRIDGGRSHSLTLNTFKENAQGVVLCGDERSHLLRNTFRQNTEAIVLCGGSTPSSIEENSIDLTNSVALRIDRNTSNVVVEAPQNDWGVSGCREISSRIRDEGSGNSVVFSPWKIPTLPKSGYGGVLNTRTREFSCDLAPLLSHAEPSDTIGIFPGTYEAGLTIGVPLTLTALCEEMFDCDSALSPTILNSSRGFGLEIRSDNVRIHGITLLVRGVSPSGETYGIEIPIQGPPTRGFVLSGSRIVAQGGDDVISGENGIRGRLEGATIVGNEFRGWTTAVFLRPYGSGNLISGNSFVGVGTGILTWSPFTRIERNTFVSALLGVDVAKVQGDPTTSADGNLLRGNNFAGALKAVRIRSDASGVVVDARLNVWGTDSWRVLPQRVEPLGEGSTILQIPFLRTLDGRQDPPPLVVEGPTTHCGSILPESSISEAIGCLHPGETLLVPASDNPIEPVPRMESVVVERNSLGELLEGVSICSAPPSGTFVPCRDLDLRSIVDSSGISNTVLSIQAPNVTVRGLTLRWMGSPTQPVVGIRMGASSPTIESNAILLQGGGCPPSAIVGGTCYTPARTTGILGSTPGARITGNTIEATILSPDGTIGGSDGLRGELAGGIVSGNTFRGWAGSAAIVWGAGLVVERNLFELSNTGLLLCTGDFGQPMIVRENTFRKTFDAIDLTRCRNGSSFVLSLNNLGLSNSVALRLKPSTAGLFVRAECNDWGVYSRDLISRRIVDEGVGNTVDFDPFLTLEGISCLRPPVADLDVSPNPTTRIDPVLFIDRTEEGSGIVVERRLEFGDGGSSSSLPTTHTYSSVGRFVATLTVRDTNGFVSTRSVPVDVVNLPPILGELSDISTSVGATIHVTFVASDPEGDTPISLALDPLPPGATFVDWGNSTATLTWTPSEDVRGKTFTLRLRATDALGATREGVFRIAVSTGNRPPVFGVLKDKTTPAGRVLAFMVSASDPDGDALTYTASSLPPGAQFYAPTRTFRWTPTSSQIGTYFVTFLVSDGSLSAQKTIRITVLENRPPIITLSIPSAPEALEPSTFSAEGTRDPDGSADLIRYEWTFQGPSGFRSTFSGVKISPTFPQAGTYLVTLKATDSEGYTSTVVRSFIVDDRIFASVTLPGLVSNNGIYFSPSLISPVTIVVRVVDERGVPVPLGNGTFTVTYRGTTAKPLSQPFQQDSFLLENGSAGLTLRPGTRLSTPLADVSTSLAFLPGLYEFEIVVKAPSRPEGLAGEERDSVRGLIWIGPAPLGAL